MIEQEQLVFPVAPLLEVALLVVGNLLLILVHGLFILTNTPMPKSTILDLKELLLAAQERDLSYFFIDLW